MHDEAEALLDWRRVMVPVQNRLGGGTVEERSDPVSRVLRHWLLIVSLALALFVGLPWLAPALMAKGYEWQAHLIYFAYGLTCHQLPERSYFLFGTKAMYSLNEIQAVWPSDNILLRRQFVGTPEMGYKVAFSDRMVSMYTAMLVGALLYGLLRRRLPRLSWRLFLVVGVLPMFLDGFSHLVNDVTEWGFRDTNAWFATLTSHQLAASFYAGDALGSLNWWLRLVTGVLFGLTTVWFIFPFVQQSMDTIGTPPRRDVDLR